MRRLRISAISYLNTAPLMWDFEHADPRPANSGEDAARNRAARDFDISYTLPSACARSLADGTADIGIIPAAAYTEIPALQIVPEVAIASRREVRSILLVSKVPIDQVRTIGLDTSSLTSVALTKVLFEKWLGGARTYTPMPPDVEIMLATHDAGLLIGDPALKIDRARYHTLDLAEEWIRHTGKPFVFAFWAARTDALREAPPSFDLPAVFQRSRDHGLKPSSLHEIAREWSLRLDLSKASITSYLTQNIHYQLDAGCLDGLRLFYRYAAEIGALPAAPELRFMDATKAVAL
jgi:chorismate dehydratase